MPAWMLTTMLFGPTPAALPADDPTAALRTLVDASWEFRLREDPLFATAVGDHRYADRLPSLGRQDLARRERFWRQTLERLRAIDRARLGSADRIDHELLERELRDELVDLEFGAYRMPLNADSGFHTELARLPQQARFETLADYEAYLARLRAVPAYFAQQMALMREGLTAGFTLPRVVLEGYEVTVASHVLEQPSDSVFWAPFRELPASLPASEHERLRVAARDAILAGPVAGYRAFLEFLVEEYVPGCRETLGASELPQGRRYYEELVRRFTTLELSPRQVHDTGLAEVARIQEEMRLVIARTGFQGDFAAFLAHLRSDPRFYAERPEQLLQQAAWIAKRMDGRLPALFKTLPRQPYGVEPVPEHLAPKYTAGRYVPAAPDSGRGGTYWVNTHALDSRPLYALEALTLHEAVPGHHLQNALRLELSELPAFRRHAQISAYGEGWGLYSERLGLEAGFYEDPYSDFGRLTYEMWRACRLVVDTGLHAFGWSREQAIAYLAERTALSLHEVRTETDRYISWPGQALAYKIGELKIRGLRAEAEAALGPSFDLREFHDVVLGEGPVPLTVLERLVRDWIALEVQESESST